MGMNHIGSVRLATGVDYPVRKYEPSPQTRSGTSKARLSDGPLVASRYSDFLSVLATLKTNEDQLAVWEDGFRDWLSTVVLRPLLVAVGQAHHKYNAALHACHELHSWPTSSSPPIVGLLARSRDRTARWSSKLAESSTPLGPASGATPSSHPGAGGPSTTLPSSTGLHNPTTSSPPPGTADTRTSAADPWMTRTRNGMGSTNHSSSNHHHSSHKSSSSSSVLPLDLPYLSDLPGPDEEDVAVVTALLVDIKQVLTSLPGQVNHPAYRDLVTLRDTTEAYIALSKVITGTYPRASILLQRDGNAPFPCPKGYILHRTACLADGPSLSGYQWDGGVAMPSEGRRWHTNTHPTDSALILYLLACFLDVPDWDFTFRGVDLHNRPESSGPLYVGEIPSFVPAKLNYSCLVPGKTVPRKGIPNGVVVPTPCDPPLYLLVLNGDLSLTLGGKDGMFHAVLLWLWHTWENGGGMVGDLKMKQVLRLEDIFTREHRFPSIRLLRRFFGLGAWAH